MIKRSIFSKGLEWLGFGLGLWSIGLFWPGINQMLSWPVLVGFVIGLNVLAIQLIANYRLRKGHNGTGTGHPPSSRPISVTPFH